MAKWKITSYSRSHQVTGTREVEASSVEAAREAADTVETETGAAFTQIARETRAFGYVTEPRK